MDNLVFYEKTIGIHEVREINRKLAKIGLCVHRRHDFTYNETTLPT